MSKSYTKKELNEFRTLVNKCSSINQTRRIEGRLRMNEFVEEHGDEKCDEMWKVLQQEEQDGADHA